MTDDPAEAAGPPDEQPAARTDEFAREATAEPTTDTAGEAAEDAAPPGKPKLTKAQKLEARAARLRAAEEARAERARVAAEAGPAAAAPASRGWQIATIVLSGVTAALVAVLIIGYLSWQHQRDVNSARSGALTAAKTFAVDFGAYDYEHLDADFSKAASLMAPSFAKDYTDASNKLKQTLVQYKTQVTAQVQGAGVTSASTSKAVVVLFLDQTVKTSQSSVPRIDRNRLQISLVKQKGKWLVSKLDAK